MRFSAGYVVLSRQYAYNQPMSPQAAIAFDTHRFVKHLTESGFTEKQAETLAEEQVSLLNTNLATKADIETVKFDIETVKAHIEALRLATKADIEALRQETKADIEALRQETKADIEALRLATKADIESVKGNIQAAKFDLLKWMFAALIAQGGLIVALIKFL